MTDAEFRIVEFLMNSDSTRPADLPDWLLALLKGDRPDEPSHELITAASLMYKSDWKSRGAGGQIDHHSGRSFDLIDRRSPLRPASIELRRSPRLTEVVA
jgi:hypothetical protein